MVDAYLALAHTHGHAYGFGGVVECDGRRIQRLFHLIAAKNEREAWLFGTAYLIGTLKIDYRRLAIHSAEPSLKKWLLRYKHILNGVEVTCTVDATDENLLLASELARLAIRPLPPATKHWAAQQPAETIV